MNYMNGIGLLAGILGAIIIAIVQGRLFFVIHAWPLSLDFTVENLLNPRSPVIRPEGWDEHMKRAVHRNAAFSIVGWFLIVVGFVLQLIVGFSKITHDLVSDAA